MPRHQNKLNSFDADERYSWIADAFMDLYRIIHR